MRVLRWLGYSALGLLAIAAAVWGFARMHDGPLGMLAGGPLTSGEWVSVPPEPDWRFAHDVQTVEFQLMSPARSRTTWILEVDGRLYIPCGYMNSALGRLWKQWPIEAEQDGRAVLRVDGKRYSRQLVRVREGQIVEQITQELARKYRIPATPEAVTSGSLWLFELAAPVS
jgi:hypothetical protein